MADCLLMVQLLARDHTASTARTCCHSRLNGVDALLRVGRNMTKLDKHIGALQPTAGCLLAAFPMQQQGPADLDMNCKNAVRSRKPAVTADRKRQLA
jgi:hypothetical protein